MRLLICVLGRTHRVHLCKLNRTLTQPRMLWLEHRPNNSPALRRKRQSIGVKSSLYPTPAFRLCSPWPFSPCGPLTGLSVLCSHPRTLTHTPVAFASSSATSAPTPAGSVKSQTDKETAQTPTQVPLEDVKRILRLAHPERWRLAGKGHHMSILTVVSTVHTK